MQALMYVPSVQLRHAHKIKLYRLCLRMPITAAVMHAVPAAVHHQAEAVCLA